METEQKAILRIHGEPFNSERHLPIRYGFLKLAAATITAIVLVTNLFVGGFWLSIRLHDRMPGDLSIVLVWPCALLVLAIAVYAISGARREWLSAYWRRNVRGYVVMYRTKEEIPWCSSVAIRGDEVINRILNACPFVILWPLGGWFHRPSVWWRAKCSQWSVRRLHGHWTRVTCAITDGLGDTLRFATPMDAMAIIAERLEHAETKPFWRDSSDIPLSWTKALIELRGDLAGARREREERECHLTTLFQIIHDDRKNPSVNAPMQGWIVTQLRRIITEREAARAQVDRYANGFLPAAIKDRDAAVGRVKETVAAFEQSSRLRETLEGLRLFANILEWLATQNDTLVPRDEKRRYLEAAVGMRERIVEKMKRDRRRHGKGQQNAPAGA